MMNKTWLLTEGFATLSILQAKILEWVAMPSSRGSSQPRDRTQVSCIAGRFFTYWATGEAPSQAENIFLNIREFTTRRSIRWCSERMFRLWMGFPSGSVGKESSCNAGDLGSIPGLWRSPGGGHGNPLQYSCLENPMDRGAWWVIVHRVPNISDMTERITSTYTLVKALPHSGCQ